MTIKCECGGDMAVQETRGDGQKVVRVRKCKKCNYRIYTVEEEVYWEYGSKMIYAFSQEQYNKNK